MCQAGRGVAAGQRTGHDAGAVHVLHGTGGCEQGAMCFPLATLLTRATGKLVLLRASPVAALRLTGCCPRLRAPAAQRVEADSLLTQPRGRAFFLLTPADSKGRDTWHPFKLLSKPG